MANLFAVVTISHPDAAGSVDVDTEVRVDSLEDLFRACRDAPPSHLVRVRILGKEGEVRLNFGSFIQGQETA